MSKTIINGQYDITYLPTQQKVLDCAAEQKTPNICLCEGFGGGKTRLLGELALEFMILYPGIQIGIFRKTRVAISETTYKTFVRKVCPEEYISKHNLGSLYIELINSSSGQFFGIDNFLRKGSLEFDLILDDEAIELEEEDHMMLGGRLRGTVLPMPMKIDFTNAGAPGSYLHKYFIQNNEKSLSERDKDFRYFSCTSFENTYNPPAYFDRLKKWEGTPYYPRYVLSQWIGFEGLIFSMYDPKIHIIKPFKIPFEWVKYGFIDFGYENPFVFLWVAHDPIYDVYYVYRQRYMTKCLVKKHVEYCKSLTEKAGEFISELIADHDAENRAQFEEYWKPTIPAVKMVATGLQDVIERLLPRVTDGKPSIFIFDNDWAEKDGYWYGLSETDILLQQLNQPVCLQDEFGKYLWGTKDQPIKKHDHACDALRYGIHTRRYLSGEVGEAQFQQFQYGGYPRR